MSNLLRELDKLLIFVTVAEKGKINDASDILGLTQPSITRSVQKLEEAFGTELFLRSREGVKLTKAGSLLYEKAARMLRELEDVRLRAQHLNQDLAGMLTIGTYESLAEYLWPDFLVYLQKTHPQLHLSIRTGQYLSLGGGTTELNPKSLALDAPAGFYSVKDNHDQTINLSRDYSGALVFDSTGALIADMNCKTGPLADL